eukprot:gene8180-11066_t
MLGFMLKLFVLLLFTGYIVLGKGEMDDFYASINQEPELNSDYSNAEQINSKFSNSDLSTNFGQFVGYTGGIYLGFQLIRKVVDIVRSNKFRLSNDDEASVNELKKEQEDIWNAILNIHNMQSENSAAILNTNKELEARSESKFGEVLDSLEEKLTKLSSRINSIEELISELDRRNKIQNRENSEKYEIDLSNVTDEISKLKIKVLSTVKEMDNLMTIKNKEFKKELLDILKKSKKQ